MSLFLIEIILASFCKVNIKFINNKDGYFFSFFFWLDLLSTVSMILDIGWVSDAMFGSSGSSAINAV